ncbi:LOW QUALITY PROTEIN: hypothetical protein MXB_2241 [Myxobolus squamalis]|nr:LOW QUALITY PROTEIN: hypothetical protein MXB_2241 [Myxobolus squamalis]
MQIVRGLTNKRLIDIEASPHAETFEPKCPILEVDMQILLDKTFCVKSSLFTQSSIIMTDDLSKKLFVPYITNDIKSENFYRAVLHEITPTKVIANFEKILLNSVKYEFPKVHIVSLFRKLKKINSLEILLTHI